MKLVRVLALAVFAVSPLAAFASGGHDAVGCTGCHSIHNAKGEVIFGVAPNKAYLNPKTKQPYGGTTALCLGCHQETDKGGQGFIPISSHISHPFGLDSVNPKVANVPADLLRDGGRFECLGCHDPHMSNPNYKYLRADTNGGKNVDKFCVVCHAMKVDSQVAMDRPMIFSSMDERGGRVVSPGSYEQKAPASSSKKAKKQ